MGKKKSLFDLLFPTHCNSWNGGSWVVETSAWTKRGGEEGEEEKGDIQSIKSCQGRKLISSVKKEGNEN